MEVQTNHYISRLAELNRQIETKEVELLMLKAERDNTLSRLGRLADPHE